MAFFQTKGYLGTTFCIPRHFYVFLLSLSCFLYGVVNCLAAFVIYIVNAGKMEHSHCEGNKCLEIISCDGMQEASYHIRAVLVIGGCLAFGVVGLFGALNRNPRDLNYFSYFLAFVGALILLLVVYDFLFMATCDAYTYNVIDMVFMWPIDSFPVDQWMKKSLNTFGKYPCGSMDDFTHHNVWRWYLFTACMMAFFFLYSALGTSVFSTLTDHGELGLGENFSIHTWRDEVFLKRDIEAHFKGVEENLKKTTKDIDWRPDDPVDTLSLDRSNMDGYGSMPPKNMVL